MGLLLPALGLALASIPLFAVIGIIIVLILEDWRR